MQVSNSIVDKKLMISRPINCLCHAIGVGVISGFPTLDEVYSKASLIHGFVERTGEQRLLPNITFNCSGNITKWIFLARGKADDDAYPELQLWRTTDGITYTKALGVSTEGSQPSVSEPSIYEFSPTDPMQFEPGDVFGLHQPFTHESRLVLQYQKGGGPLNYRTMGGDPEDVIDISALDVFSDQNDYPLFAVEASKCI